MSLSGVLDIKWFASATITFSAEGRTLLFDPFLPWNKAVESFDMAQLAAADDILITHGHFDHLIDVPRVIADGKALVYCSPEAAASLHREGVAKDRIKIVNPGDTFTLGPFHVRVLKGKHIVFDRKLLLKTFISPRMFIYPRNMYRMLRETPKYPAGQVLVYELMVKDKKILHFGSLNADNTENYPIGVDIMTLPFQGRSDINKYALEFVQSFKPEMLYLHHFDDTFPPISSTVATADFKEAAGKLSQSMRVFVPVHGEVLAI